MELDDDDRLKSVFWADARSRGAYNYFGDVVTFDTTYLTNRYGMPFAPFVGVNHHGQSILLGAGLISSEDTESFIWLFKTWLDCMDGKAPNAIITDQDRAMKNAIAIVFPHTRHRYCLWHILRKVPEKLGSHGQYKCGLKSKLLSCVYDSLTIEEFENSWKSLNDTFNLHENAWLQSLYAEKEFWVPFDNALKKKVENENQADFNSFNFTIPCISHLALEKKFQNVYTSAKFKEVQQEIMGMIYCHCRFEKMEGVIAIYSVDDQVKAEDFIKEVTYTLYFNEAECEAKCVCGLFEMRGRPETVRYKRILRTFNEVITNAVSCDRHTEEMISNLYAMNEVWRTSKPSNTDSNVGGSTVNAFTEGSSKKVLSPHVVRGKGRPPCKRRMSKMEERVKKIKTKTANKRKDKGQSCTVRRRLDTEPLESTENQLGLSEMRMEENVQTPIMVNEESGQHPVMGTQESIQLGMDGTQPETEFGTQPCSF
ncbi:protein FAR-RED IMPAIRED RESPONSE 1-like [Juglans regia]|uniref:Protein FAR1-RELATED SEQUENCE n=1 Tax=Juglans regia TaxID=51240 RepID=A0A6P9EBG4_JUGRE|nr:protein FAR-RED IMPAIRED RESPONSE 1-like [Juglans regia]